MFCKVFQIFSWFSQFSFVFLIGDTFNLGVGNYFVTSLNSIRKCLVFHAFLKIGVSNFSSTSFIFLEDPLSLILSPCYRDACQSLLIFHLVAINSFWIDNIPIDILWLF